MAQKLPHPHNHEPIMKFEYFTIYPFDGHLLWLEMDGGEGMTFPKAELMGFLSKIWKRY